MGCAGGAGESSTKLLKFGQEDEARQAGLDSKALEAAMRRLFKAKAIRNAPHGYPSRPSFHIAVAEG
ncbi:MAG TPA: hypothetical protein VH230_01465 [Stellaceae bacterium]|nr:hypothetical protein [Stellaceae bacterium]